MMYHSAVHWYMIGSFRDRWLREFFVNDTRSAKIPADLADRLFRKLQLLDDATCDVDLRVPPSNHFEKLSGHLKDWHSIRVNRQWRLIFLWNAATGEADGVYLDKHEYR
jgi:toxin HigB-1